MLTKRLPRSAASFAFVLCTATTTLVTPPPASAAESVATPARAVRSVDTSMASAEAKTAPEMTIALREPEVPRARKSNRFVVTLENSGGGPVSDADVRVTLHNAGVPGPKGFFEYPMQTTVRLHEGERPGTYEGIGAIPRRGTWHVTVAANQHGHRVARETMTLWAQ